MYTILQPITNMFAILFNAIQSTLSNTIGFLDNGTIIVLSISILTIIVKLFLLPFSIKSAKSTARMQEIQPEVKKIQTKYKGNSDKINSETMKLYKEKNVSLTGGCLPALLPLPILMSLYVLFTQLDGIQGSSFLFINDLSYTVSQSFATGNMIILTLPVLVFLSTYLPSALLAKSNPTGQNMTKMTLIMSGFMAFMAFNFQSILIIYWILGGIIQLIQTYFLNYRPYILNQQTKS